MVVQSPQKGGSGQTGLIVVIAGELARTSLGQYARDRGMPDIYSYHQKLTTKLTQVPGAWRCHFLHSFHPMMRRPGGGDH